MHLYAVCACRNPGVLPRNSLPMGGSFSPHHPVLASVGLRYTVFWAIPSVPDTRDSGYPVQLYSDALPQLPVSSSGGYLTKLVAVPSGSSSCILVHGPQAGDKDQQRTCLLCVLPQLKVSSTGVSIQLQSCPSSVSTGFLQGP